MTDEQLHDLAVTFANVKLQEYQLEQRVRNDIPFNSESDDDEIRFFAKMYKLVINQFEIEYDSID